MMKAWVFLALLVVAAVAEADNEASTEPASTEEFAERAVFEVRHTPGGCTFDDCADQQQGPGKLGHFSEADL
jgi:hypothetical protein